MRLPRFLRRVRGYEHLQRRDQFFYRFTRNWSPLGFGWGDLWEKEAKVVRYAWWVGSRGVYLWLRPKNGIALRFAGGRLQVRVSREAFPRVVRRPLCARRGHVMNKWVVGYDAYECLCGAQRVTGPQILRDKYEEEN